MRRRALPAGAAAGKLRFMNSHRTPHLRLSLLCGLLLTVIPVCRSLAQPTPEAAAAFSRYTAGVEARLFSQHASPAGFLVTESQPAVRIQHGELVIEQLSPTAQPAGALLHHWRGTAFAPGATAAQFEQLLRDFRAYPRVFAPQVVDARAVPASGDSLQAVLRVRQKHAITVVLETSYDVRFGRLDAQDGFSASRSTRIYELDAPGTDHERALTPAEEHGFLWRLNTYWTYQQREGGLYLQIESVSLSRSIPAGLGWALRPYVTAVPRQSLEFTLRSAVNALRPSSAGKGDPK